MTDFGELFAKLMTRRTRRLDKKIHRRVLGDEFDSLTLDSFWRKRLFDADFHKAFHIDVDHLDGVPVRLAEAVKKFNLRFLAAKVRPEEAEPWLSDGGMIVFKFWALEYSSVSQFTGNNPEFVFV